MDWWHYVHGLCVVACCLAVPLPAQHQANNTGDHKDHSCGDSDSDDDHVVVFPHGARGVTCRCNAASSILGFVREIDAQLHQYLGYTHRNMSALTMARTEERQEEVGEKVVWDIAGDPSWDVPRHGMRAQTIHRVEFVRHGESNANQRLTDDGDVSCDPDPRLTDRGRSQAEDVGRYYARMIGDSDPEALRPNIETSTLRRAVHTSLPTQRLFVNAPVDVNPDVRERWCKDSAWLMLPAADGEPRPIRWLCTPETLSMFRERVDAVATRWRTTGTAQKRAHSIVFTHSLFISSVLTHLIPVASHEDEPPQLFHIPNGSITVLDFDTEGRMHVHCVGFTGHLRQPTGHHTAHVDCCPAPHAEP